MVLIRVGASDSLSKKINVYSGPKSTRWLSGLCNCIAFEPLVVTDINNP